MTAQSDAQFTITRIFNAPRELVWQAWTESADAAEWWHPRGILIKDGSVSVDARPGGRYAYTMVNPADGSEYPTAGVYREVDPPRRLVFTWASPGDPDDTAPVITVDLRELDDDRTEMLFHVRGFPGAPGDENVYDGWDSAFDLLGEQLAARII
ncbi:SRPBCC family protein [Agromyces bracchium]|uniref:SRPBCC domain-containing protein n=1 Tax=Agromyces bracchium TaxID=88376 RepID=A0A6I3M745_9MICO|nr:SRPBCC domain-containing protein [Agromyces bracchium]MTH70480.1 SRPBCC domain-containing protein [Agromyces bracchium]